MLTFFRGLCGIGISCMFAANIFAYESCNIDHIEGRGLGYSTGYTSLDLFFAEPLATSCSTFTPFADLRGHVFNDGNTAANAGGGVRWLPECGQYVVGINAFYDYLKSTHRTYQQVSMGLEALGCQWEFRINGYVPVGNTKRPLYAFNYEFTPSNPFQLRGREQVAMKGVDSEIGYRFCVIPCLNLYAGIGPYVYWGRTSATKNVWNPRNEYALGGRVRMIASIFEYVSVEGVTTYDAKFKWTGQGRVSITLPFDLIFGTSCACASDQRFYQPVIRNEIIAIHTAHRYTNDPAVLNPENEP